MARPTVGERDPADFDEKVRLKPLPLLIFSSRWLQLPLYVGLILAQFVYVFLFICGGAFAGLEKIIGDRMEGKSIGFGAHVAAPDERRTGEVLRHTEPEDLLKFGLIPEFVGRLPVIATLEDLDTDALVKILKEPKNALVKQYQKLFDMEDVKLTYTEDALVATAKKAIERKTGARGLRSIMENILLDTMFDLPSMDGVDEVMIDKDVVEGRKDPVRVYAQKAAEDAA